MIAVVDIGNSLVKCGVFDNAGVLTAERSFAASRELDPEAADLLLGVEKAVIGSVVPSLTPLWAELLMRGVDVVHVAGHDSPWGFKSAVEQPEKVGVDRLANMEGALAFPGAVLVVDAGTATKFDLLEGLGEKREFPGGAIAPGLGISYEALLARTAQLPKIELQKHSPVVGYNTETAIRSGVLHGFASQVDGMILRIFEERQLPATTAVIATGGNSRYLQGRARLLTHMRPRLTLEGLHAIGRKI